MNRSITHIVFLQQLLYEHSASQQLLHCLNRVVLRTDMEHCLILVVAKLEIFLGAVEREIFLKHGDVVILQGIVEGQVPIVVHNVRPRLYLVDQF